MCNLCGSSNCDCDDIFKQPDFLDGAHLDASVVEGILAPYPELWAQWQTRVLEAGEGRELGAGGLRMYHSPTYLKSVVHEFEHLRQGGDHPDPAHAARCEAIVSERPEFARERRQHLNDPWWRAQTAEMLGYEPVGVSHYYDPAWLQRRVDLLNKHDDPFSREAIEFRLWSEKLSFPPDKRKAAGPHN